MSLTEKQSLTLDFIADYMRQYRRSPALDEIRDRLGLKSISSVHKHLVTLEKLGLIRRVRRKARGIRISRNRCPFCFKAGEL